MKGPDVHELMVLLFKEDYLTEEPPANADVFTDEVEVAVKKYQTDHEMVATGRVTGVMVLLLKNPK